MRGYRGKFITFEGSEGSGKTTQIDFIHQYLKKLKKDVLILREPGGVKISEEIRKILLDVKNTEMGSECETLLYMAARAQLVHEVLEPALQKGRIILCDRFLDSTIVYQGYGRGIDLKMIKMIGQFATRSIEPDLTFFFDIDVKEGLARINRAKDRIERRSVDYHNKVRAGYLALAKQNPRRIKKITAGQSKEEIHAIVCYHVNKLLGLWNKK